MKKVLFSATALLVALCFASCDKSGNGGDLKISAKVENGSALNALLDEVRAVGYIQGEEIPIDWNEDGVVDWYDYEYSDIIIATAPFKNGGFTITLPKKIDERLLRPFENAPEGISISNKNFKSTSVDEIEAYKNNEYVGDFWYASETETAGTYVQFMFVDADVKITGTFTDTEWDNETYKYDANLKKGWNTVYWIEKGTESSYVITFTTKKPDVDLKWIFDGSTNWEDYYAPKKALKKHSSKFFKFFKFSK